MGLFRPVDQFRWSAELDVVSVDSYPDPADAEAYLASAMTYDLTRSVGGGRAVAADGAGAERGELAGRQRPESAGTVPARLSLQAVARGADAVLSFQWRAAATGAEKFHSGMLPHAGTGSRVWREVVRLGTDAAPAGPGRGPPGAGRRRRCCWTGRAGGRSSWTRIRRSRLRLTGLLGEFYRPLFEAGVTADFAHPEADLSGYRLVVVPALYLVSDAGADNVRRYVERGGTALITFFSGIVDPADRVRLGGYPAPWCDLLGLRVEELAPLPDGRTVRLEGLDAARRRRARAPGARAPGARAPQGRAPGERDASGRTSSTFMGRLPC